MMNASTPQGATNREGLMIMTTYTTRTLAVEVIGDEGKAATRELRKFLRADAVAKGGRVGVDTPGKGGRYTLDLTKPQLRAMIKRFTAWQVAQEAEKAKRAEALEAAKKVTVTETVDEVETDNEDNEVEGPTDEEIAAMLSDEDDTDN